MKLEAAFSGVSRLAIDSAPLIYYFAPDDSSFKPMTRRVFRKIVDSEIACFTSVITLTEVLQKPFQEGRADLVEAYRNLLTDSPAFALLPVDVTIAEEAARLRAQYNIKTPDALQIATALSAGCEAFLTNDEALRRVGEVQVLVLKELVS